MVTKQTEFGKGQLPHTTARYFHHHTIDVYICINWNFRQALMLNILQAVFTKACFFILCLHVCLMLNYKMLHVCTYIHTCIFVYGVKWFSFLLIYNDWFYYHNLQSNTHTCLISLNLYALSVHFVLSQLYFYV